MKNSYILYALIDPRDDLICYIGVTTQSPGVRLSQHRNSINDTPISKLSQHLRNQGLKLDMKILANFENSEDMWTAEIETIKYYLNSGVKLKNVSSGGKIAPLSQSSIQKMIDTKRKAGMFSYDKMGGVNSRCTKLSEETVSLILEMLLKGMNNEEIASEADVSVSVIKAIRSGQNWKPTFEGKFGYNIPSIPTYGSVSGSQDKLKVVHLIALGYDDNFIKRSVPNINKSDLKRIRSKTLWIKVWKVYENIVPEVRNNLCKPVEFRGSLTASGEDNPERSLEIRTCND